MSNAPTRGKSCVLSIVISLIITILSLALAPVLPNITVPPLPNSYASSDVDVAPVILYLSAKVVGSA